MEVKYFKEKLEEEKKRIEENLSTIAKPSSKDKEDWETTPEDLNVMVADRNELADVFEEKENKEALEVEIEERLNKVKRALQRIEDGTYGTCKEGCIIEPRRLEADPSAETCIKHAGS